MFDIGNILSIAINTALDIRDSVSSGQYKSINSSIITLQCVATSDIPVDTITSYAKALEVIYGTVLRGVLTIQDRNRLNSSPSAIFKSLPLLTPYDKIAFDKKLGAFASVKDTIFNKGVGGNQALKVFTECFKEGLDQYLDLKSNYGMENIIVKDAGNAGPTFVDISVNVNQINGKPIEKKFSIGIQVRPKIVQPQEMTQFIVKRNLAIAETDAPTRNFWQKTKTKFSMNYSMLNNSNIDSSDKKTLNDMMNSVKGIKKPFICVFMSGHVKNELVDLGVDIMKPKLLQALYDTLPIMSVGIYDTNTDIIYSSLLRDSYFVEKSAAEFNSEISQYEKQLSELIRVNKIYG